VGRGAEGDVGQGASGDAAVAAGASAVSDRLSAFGATSLAWIGLAGVLLALESDGGVRVADVVAFTFAGSGLLTLVGSRGRHLAWVVFLAIAGLVWLGVR
jgi:hypothetical protein